MLIWMVLVYIYLRSSLTTLSLEWEKGEGASDNDGIYKCSARL